MEATRAKGLCAARTRGPTLETVTARPDDQLIDEIRLADDRRIIIRATRAGDSDALQQLAEHLSRDDARRRFFTATQPREAWFAQWASIGERGGYGVIAFLQSSRERDGGGDAERREVVGEAGYALLPDGDGELALTVAANWRGWLGAYLLDVIVSHAATAGIANLQAEVLLENRPMLALLRHCGAVARDHPNGTMRLSISTTGHVPSWPLNDRRHRVLVEVPGGRWTGEPFAEIAGMQLALCSGPGHRRGDCPELCDGSCPLVDGADAIVVLLDPDDQHTAELLTRHHERRPDTPIFVRAGTGHADPFIDEIERDGEQAVEAIRARIDARAQHPDHQVDK